MRKVSVQLASVTIFTKYLMCFIGLTIYTIFKLVI